MLEHLDRFLNKIRSIKVKIPNTLFDVEPNWEMLKEKRCPICGNRLSIPLKNPFVVICRGRRHGDKKPFIIKRRKYEELSK